MRGWRRVCTATTVAAAFFVCCIGVPAGKAAEAEAAHTILFSGADLWRNGAFAHGGLLWSPDGLDRDGFTFKAVISGGGYRYDAGDLGGARVVGAEVAGQLLPGWRFKNGPMETKVFIGPEIRRNWLSPYDPGNRLRGSKVGLRAAIEFWNEPTPTTMVAADASVSSIATDYSARVAFGWRMLDHYLDRFYVGPEAQVYGADGYRQLRFGAHITCLKIVNGELSAATGWSIASDNRSGPYLRLGFMQRR